MFHDVPMRDSNLNALHGRVSHLRDFSIVGVSGFSRDENSLRGAVTHSEKFRNCRARHGQISEKLVWSL